MLYICRKFTNRNQDKSGLQTFSKSEPKFKIGLLALSKSELKSKTDLLTLSKSEPKSKQTCSP
jgi:hypothetical protein